MRLATAPGPATDPLRTGLAILVIAASLFWATALNRGPILLNDSVAYVRAGESLMAVGMRVLGAGGNATADRANGHAGSAAAARPEQATAPAAPQGRKGIPDSRSPYFGLPLAVVNRLGGAWLQMLAQAVIAATALLLAIRRLGLAGRPLGWIAIAAAVAAGLSFYAMALMPDLLLGPAILAMALLIATPRMRRLEWLFWTTTLLFALLSHRSYLAVGVGLLAVTLSFFRAAWFRWQGWATAACICLAAIGGHAAVRIVVEKVMRQQVIPTPFLVARLGELPLLRAYLDQACPTRRYLLCDYRDRLPTGINTFIWHGPSVGGIYQPLDKQQRLRFAAEEGEIVLGAIATYPREAAIEAVRAFGRQFFLTGTTDFAYVIKPYVHVDPTFMPAVRAYRESRIYQGSFPYAAVDGLMRGIYVGSFAAVVILGIALARHRRLGRRGQPGFVPAALIILTGLVGNAAVCALFSGVFDRYQGRVAWLMPLAAAALLAAWLDARRAEGPGRQRS